MLGVKQMIIQMILWNTKEKDRKKPLNDIKAYY